jgi:hypothetical protein
LARPYRACQESHDRGDTNHRQKPPAVGLTTAELPGKGAKCLCLVKDSLPTPRPTKLDLNIPVALATLSAGFPLSFILRGGNFLLQLET